MKNRYSVVRNETEIDYNTNPDVVDFEWMVWDSKKEDWIAGFDYRRLAREFCWLYNNE